VISVAYPFFVGLGGGHSSLLSDIGGNFPGGRFFLIARYNVNNTGGNAIVIVSVLLLFQKQPNQLELLPSP
jgi:hypothetical protein